MLTVNVYSEAQAAKIRPLSVCVAEAAAVNGGRRGSGEKKCDSTVTGR